MLKTRILVVVILLPVGLFLIYLGGWVFAIFLALALGVAGWEFTQLFRASKLSPALAVVMVGIVLLVLGRQWDGFTSSAWLIALLLMVAMTYHLIAYERGQDQAGTDFVVTVAGALYLGWLGSYFVSLRNLDQGLWWLLLVLPTVWIADTGAYLIGRQFGKHKLSPRLSPKKTWEGYIGGIIFGTAGTVLLALLYQRWAGPGFDISILECIGLGLVLTTLTTLGDLGESMIKRQNGVKDSSNLLPGHGGIFDRIDSWLWAAPIGFYFLVWLVL